MKKNSIKLCSVVLICVLLWNVLCSVNPVFAVENMVFKCADVSGDGVVDAKDALEVLKYSAKLIDTFSVIDDNEEDVWDLGDVTGNNEINAKDALEILKYAAGLVTDFSIAERYPSVTVEEMRAIVLENIENEVSLGEYKGIEVEVEKLVVTEDDVMEEINLMLEMMGEEELTDEIVAEIAGEEGITTVEEFKEYIRMYLEQTLVFYQESYDRQTVMEQVIAGSTIHSYNDPDLDVNKMCEEIIAVAKEEAALAEMSYEEFVNMLMGMSVEEFEAELRREYQFLVDTALVYRAIAKAENISVSQDEYNAAYAEQIADYELMGYESVEEYAKAIYEEVLYTKVQDMLMENSVVNYR